MAVALVGICELGARALVSSRKLEPDMSLRKTLDQRIERISTNNPSIWLLGNSTLDYGLDEKHLGELLHTDVIKLAHGSATINASAAMLDFYYKQTSKKPQQVIVTLTKDDLNPNGYRAKRSNTYIELDQTQILPETEYLMLRRARGNIRNILGIGPLVLDAKDRANLFSKQVKAYDGKPLGDINKLERELVEDYRVAEEWFVELKAAADKLGLPAPVIVIMPTTDQYQIFHDKLVVSPKYDATIQEIINAANKAGLSVIKQWADPRKDYNRFRDPYHLRPEGQKWFTERFAEVVSPYLTSTTTQPVKSP